jgi:hypothetical protein
LSAIGNIFSQLQHLGLLGEGSGWQGFQKRYVGVHLQLHFEYIVKKVNTQGVENINTT